MADNGQFFNDLRAPFMPGADLTTVSLTTTNKALYPPSNFPVLGGQYWNFVGKRMKIRLFGKMTTVATPGNLSFGVYYGTGADANGVLLASSGAVALSTNQTNLSWWLEVCIRCASIGSAGTLYVTGIAHPNVGLVASTLQPMLIPASAAAASGACDLTAANIISVQAIRSGSDATTMTVQDLEVVSMN